MRLKVKLRAIPSGRMCSLRHALMMWLLPVFLLVGAASAYVAHWSYTSMVREFMDNQMSLLAYSLARQEQLPPLERPLTRSNVHKWGTYVAQVFDHKDQLEFSTWPELQTRLQEHQGFADVRNEQGRWRIYTSTVGEGAEKRSVQIVQSADFRTHIAAERVGAAVLPVLVLLPLSMLILWGVVAVVTRSLGDVARQAAAQDEHSIAELPLERVPQEISPLVMSFNSLLSRLRDAFTAQRRFVQDAAHELRTPIAAIGLQLENLRGDIGQGASAQRFAQLEAGVQRAQRLVDQLLKLSRQEAASAASAAAAAEAQPANVNLFGVLRESINTLIALADKRGIDLGLLPSDVAEDQAVLRCSASELRSVLDNLIENALRYTPAGGVVDVRVLREGGKLVVEVIDNGPGIAPDLLQRVFDRFFRVPGTETPGNGLGLAIAQAAAQRCGLHIDLRNREGHSGLVARVAAA